MPQHSSEQVQYFDYKQILHSICCLLIICAYTTVMLRGRHCFSLNLPIVLTSAGHHVMGRNDHQISRAIAVYVGLHSTREDSVFYYSNWGFEIFKMCEILQI